MLFTILGILIILFSVYLFIVNKWYKQQLEKHQVNPTYNTKPNKPIISISKPWVLTIVGIVVMLFSGAFFWAEAGTAYAVQYPWGGDKIIRTQGIKAKWWGRTIPISYEISVKFIKPNSEGNIPKNEQGVINLPAKWYAFADAIKANIELSTIIRLNIDDEQKFLNMADKNRSENKLIYGRIIPNIEQSIKNTCKLMDAQDYISGYSAEFDRYFQDQLNNGAYRIEPYYEEEEVPQIIGDTATVRTVGVNKSRQKKFRIMEDDSGNPIRDLSNNKSLTEYGLSFTQAHVTSIDWEQSFDKRLQLQKEQVAQTQLEKQEAEKEYYRQEKERAKGESEKVKERMKLEKEQIQITIAAETKAKAAKFKEEEEDNLLAAADKEARRIKVLADAEAYKNQRLVSAGLTPQERAEYDLKTADVVSKNLSQMKVPSNIITGGGTGTSTTEALLQVNLLKDILKGNN